MDHRVLFSEALKIVDPWYIQDIEFDPLRHRLNIHINFKKGAVLSTTMTSQKNPHFIKPTTQKKKYGVI